MSRHSRSLRKTKKRSDDSSSPEPITRQQLQREAALNQAIRLPMDNLSQRLDQDGKVAEAPTAIPFSMPPLNLPPFILPPEPFVPIAKKSMVDIPISESTVPWTPPAVSSIGGTSLLGPGKSEPLTMPNPPASHKAAEIPFFTYHDRNDPAIQEAIRKMGQVRVCPACRNHVLITLSVCPVCGVNFRVRMIKRIVLWTGLLAIVAYALARYVLKM